MSEIRSSPTRLQSLIETWRHGRRAMCHDGETDQPCDGIQQCATDLEAALPVTSMIVGLVSRRPSDGAVFVGGVEFSEAQARRIVSDLLELLPVRSETRPQGRREETKEKNALARADGE